MRHLVPNMEEIYLLRFLRRDKVDAAELEIVSWSGPDLHLRCERRSKPLSLKKGLVDLSVLTLIRD